MHIVTDKTSETDKLKKMRAIATLIVAVDTNLGIGKDGKLPWPRLEKDMEFFLEMTDSSIVIMGLKTWDSLPKKPLSKRINYVISKKLTTLDLVREYGAQCAAFNNLDDAVLSGMTHFPESKIYIIGGADIYKEALNKNIVRQMFVTEIQQKFQCDTFFPKITDNFEKIRSSEMHTQEIKTGDDKNPVVPIRYQIHTYNLIQNMSELGYLELMGRIVHNGYDVDPSNERTGTGTKSIWGSQLSFDLTKGFPLLTTKKTYLRGIFED